MARRKRFSAEFKRQALRRAAEPGMTDALVCEELGQVPDPGARLRLDSIEIEVLSADERRVRSVRVRRREAPQASSPEEAVSE